MKQLSILIFSLIPFISFSQKVYSVEYSNQSDLKVFVVEYENQSDLKVFKVDYTIRQRQTKIGILWITPTNLIRKYTFVEYSNQSDLKNFLCRITQINQVGEINPTASVVLNTFGCGRQGGIKATKQIYFFTFSRWKKSLEHFLNTSGFYFFWVW